MDTAVATQQSRQPLLGRGSIGEITPEHVTACNEWLKPLAARDGFGQSANIGASDIRNLLDLGRTANAVVAAPTIREGDAVRTMLLVDLANVTRVIRWGMAPQEDEPTSEMRCRLTARGRRMLQQCCKDLWDQMLYGKQPDPIKPDPNNPNWMG